MERGKMNFDNAVQRNLVWDNKKKSLQIHRMIYGYAIPAMYFTRDVSGLYFSHMPEWAQNRIKDYNLVLRTVKARTHFISCAYYCCLAVENDVSQDEINRTLADFFNGHPSTSLEYNHTVSAFQCGAPAGSDHFTSLTPEQIERYPKRFHTPKMFWGMDGRIVCLPPEVD